ncbi:Ig-like domain-containing protein [Flavobacterium sp.]|uniref:Ig-like domain-containing protein n=1 Tax=Flavobacterium sp. TaxID=239 RepID=UPI003C66E810
MKKITTLLLLTLTVGQLYAQLRIGDPGVTVDQSKFDSDYPQMSRWANAGVNGGIPFINSYNKTASISPGNSSAINAAITSMSNSLSTGQKGLITLTNGTYTINAAVVMKSNVSLIGESRTGVICSITMTSGDAFSFNNVQNCGIYKLTIQGSWSQPTYNWNYSLDANREFSNSNISVRLKNGTTNCWLDKVTILNSANDPMRCPADHNTFRDLIVDGCKRKAGGAEGYFFIQGRDNLITACQITHIRHISLQGGNVEYNVVYDNDFRQEVSFHSGDAGNNLIANNRITLPVDMPPVAPGDADAVTPVEARNNKPDYFAIMGPWSTQHTNSANPNFIYKNKCVQDNHNFGSRTPWSDDSKVYYGPKKLGLTIQERIDNFPEYGPGAPSGGTLYAVNLGITVPVSGVSVSPTSLSLSIGNTQTVSTTISPGSASNKSVLWTSSNTAVATVNTNGVITAIAAGTATITVKTVDGNKTASCLVTVTATQSNLPVVSFLKPTNNQNFTVGSTVAVTVNATDNGTISNVKLYLNGSLVRQESTAPYEWAYNSTNDPVLRNMVAGTYTLKAVATDNTGFLGEKSITFTVNTILSKMHTSLNVEENDVPVLAFPNPFTNELVIQLDDTLTQYISLIDTRGNIVLRQTVEKGATKVVFSTSHLNAGVYIVQFFNGTNSIKTIKVLKE